MNRDRDFLTRLVIPSPNFAVSDCRLRKGKHVALAQTCKHAERNRKPQLLGNAADHCSALIQGPWTICVLGIPRSLDPLHPLDRIFVDNPVFFSMLASHRNYG